MGSTLEVVVYTAYFVDNYCFYGDSATHTCILRNYYHKYERTNSSAELAKLAMITIGATLAKFFSVPLDILAADLQH